jgi:membrane-bound lytic murein transglycosylase D
MLQLKWLKTTFLSLSLLSILVAAHALGPGATAKALIGNYSDSTKQLLSIDSMLLRIKPNGNALLPEAPPILINKRVSAFADDYNDDNGMLFDKMRESKAAYFDIMDSVFTKYEIPVEMKYLAVIESKLNTNSVSHAGAAGAWQLMPVAARTYSLKVGRYDERKNFYKSTVAAAKLMKDLYKMFGDWILVVAAYNSGPGGVLKAMKKSGSKDYWKMEAYLPLETRKHVKRFISTHYFFEEKGSVATLTSQEAGVYRKKLSSFVEEQNLLLSRPVSPVDEAAATIATPLKPTPAVAMQK